MLRSQRILIVVGLVIIAWLLHVTTCDWAVYRTMEYWNTQRMSSSRIVLGWETAATVGTTPPPNQAMPGTTLYNTKFTGVMVQGGVERWQAIYLGVILPIALLIGAGVLYLGGRHATRVSRGLCPTCGYDLRASPQPLAKCPECGTPAPPPRP